MQKVHYVVQDEGYTQPRHLVLRKNKIGQGWGVASYRSRNIAERVADFLSRHAEEEAD